MIDRIGTISMIVAIVFLTGVVFIQGFLINKQYSSIRSCITILVANGIVDIEDFMEPQEEEAPPEDKGFTL